MEPTDLRRFRRDLQAMARKADDADGFAQLVELSEHLANLLAVRANQLHDEGYSAAELAAPLGVTRQAFHKRFLGAR